jgi:hypothetical protein
MTCMPIDVAWLRKWEIDGGRYSGSNKCPNVCMFSTKVYTPQHLLTWALTCECIEWSAYPWLTIDPKVKRFG